MLKRKISAHDERARLDEVLASLTIGIAEYARTIGVESPDDPISLDTKNLTLIRHSKGGRKDHLWEIGSGANWLGYHVATFLALHEFLLKNDRSPVARFLVLDQPSQVYFPDRWPGDPDPKKPNKVLSSEKDSDDIARVHLIFETISRCVERTHGRIQIIVIDHADEPTWSGLENIKTVQRWRGVGPNSAFIPQAWIDALDKNASRDL